MSNWLQQALGLASDESLNSKNPSLEEAPSDKLQKNLDFIKLVVWGVLRSGKELNEEEIETLKSNLEKFVYGEKIEILKNLVERLCLYGNVMEVLIHWNESIIKLVLKFIETPEQFEELCWNEDIREVLIHWNEYAVEIVFKKFQIKSLDKLERLCWNENVREALKYWNESTIKLVLKFIETLEQFEKLCWNKNVCGILKCYVSLGLFFANWVIKRLEQFIQLCSDENVYEVLTWKLNEEALKYLFKKFEIDTPEQFIRLCSFSNIQLFLETGEIQYFGDYLDTIPKE
jgi:hypothetical protein